MIMEHNEAYHQVMNAIDFYLESAQSFVSHDKLSELEVDMSQALQDFRGTTTKGLIMIGYQGIGKSSCAGKDNCIDLESGNFWVEGKRADDWYIPYCNIAMHLANQGYTVFTSSHKVVRDQFSKMPLAENVGKIVVFCPELRYKNEWIERLQKRYNETGLEKDYKALMNAKECFDENIIDLVNDEFPVYQPAAMPEYDLMNSVIRARRRWCRK